MNIIEALESRELFGALPAFRDLSTWGPWLAFLKAFYGLPMDAGDLALFRKHTGRQTPREGGFPEAAAIVGVQSGKSRIAGAVAGFEALRGGAGTHSLLLGQDQRGAMRVLLRYAREPFEELDAFKAEVEHSAVDVAELRNGVSLSAYPCRPAAVRGLRACFVGIDELAFFTATDGRPTDTEMLRVARGRVATTGGKILILSSPYGQAGALWDLHRKHYGREDSPVLVWVGSAPDMNPTLPADYIERMREDDPEAFRSEVMGEFRQGITSLFSSDALDACVVRGRKPEMLPEQGKGKEAKASFDSTGGRNDAGALSIGWKDGDEIIIGFVRRWPAPCNPDAVIAEAAGVLRDWGLSRVQVDRYAAEFPIVAFARQGITATVAEDNTSDHFLNMLPTVNAGAVQLPDYDVLLRELRGLERRRGATKDRVDHRPGSHDDTAASVAGVIALLTTKRRNLMVPVISVTKEPNAGPFSTMRERRPLYGSGVMRAPDDSGGRWVEHGGGFDTEYQEYVPRRRGR